MLYSIGLLFWHWSCLPQCIRGWHESLFFRSKSEFHLPRMPEVCSDKIETPPAKKKNGWINEEHVSSPFKRWMALLVTHVFIVCWTNIFRYLTWNNSPIFSLQVASQFCQNKPLAFMAEDIQFYFWKTVTHVNLGYIKVSKINVRKVIL